MYKTICLCTDKATDLPVVELCNWWSGSGKPGLGGDPWVTVLQQRSVSEAKVKSDKTSNFTPKKTLTVKS